MKILLHTCCADCLLKYIDALNRKIKDDIEVDIYYYNPNIQPRSEYLARLQAVKEVKLNEIQKTYPNTKLIVADWSPKEYFAKLNGITDKSRCPLCWALRLENSFKYAKEHNYEVVSSSMITSSYMDRDMIEKIGLKFMKQYGVRFEYNLEFDQELKTGGFYKQNYCGCVYSLNERYEEKVESGEWKVGTTSDLSN
jgi:predicted adenine nucleotide alpha hydrolase (AANH) superfamily ATPase